MALTQLQKQEAINKQLDEMTDAAITELVCELRDERARMVAHIVQRRMKQLRLRLVITSVVAAVLVL